MVVQNRTFCELEGMAERAGIEPARGLWRDTLRLSGALVLPAMTDLS